MCIEVQRNFKIGVIKCKKVKLVTYKEQYVCMSLEEYYYNQLFKFSQAYFSQMILTNDHEYSPDVVKKFKI